MGFSECIGNLVCHYVGRQPRSLSWSSSIHCLIHLLSEAKFLLFFFSFFSFFPFPFLSLSLSTCLITIHCQEALSLLPFIVGPSVVIPCVQVIRSSVIRPINDRLAESLILHKCTCYARDRRMVRLGFVECEGGSPGACLATACAGTG